MRTQNHYPCNFAKACHAHWCIKVMGWSLTRTAIVLELNVGTVWYVIHRERFPDAYPVPLPGYGAA